MDNRKLMQKSFHFNKRVQAEDEDFHNFYNNVSQLILGCGYGDLSERLLRDKIISGVRDKMLQNHLLGIDNLTLQQAKEVAIKWYQEKKDKDSFRSESNTPSHTMLLSSQSQSGNEVSPSNSCNKEAQLQKISKFISINEERRDFTNYFDTVRDRILKNLQMYDGAFKTLYSGYDLAGSYADNLKVLHANEFDLQIYLGLKEFRSLKVKSTKNFPGLVEINAKDVLEEIQKMQQYKQVYEQLKNLVDNEGYIIPGQLQSWFQKLFTKVLNDFGKNFTYEGSNYDLVHSQSGPAHTITVTVNRKDKFSVDFVPVIKLTADDKQWVADRNYIKTFDNLYLWVAVPKPRNDAPRSFQTSYDKMERSLIKFKGNLKNVDRLLKKLRDRYDINNFKSYYIKTVCLWVNAEVPKCDEFWRKSLWEVLLHVFDRIVSCCEEGKMPFFWNKNQNMFSKLTENQIKDMKGKWQSLLKKLKNDDSPTIPLLFLDKEEMVEFTAKFGNGRV